MLKKSGWKKWVPVVTVIAAVSIGLSASIQGILQTGQFWRGTFAGALLIFILSLTGFLVWRKAGAGKMLAWMMIAAFTVRLAFGVFLAWGLPLFGYEEPSQQAGFVFFDAFRRDGSAWDLAQSGEPLYTAFSDKYSSDQYGGLLWISALVYRTISPDAYRSWLVLILSAAVMALSIPFFVGFVKRRLGEPISRWAGWILALYPEGLLLGASQMREPFYIFFFCVVLWAAGNWLNRLNLKLSLPLAGINALAFLSFSYRVAVPVLGATFLWVWVEESGRIKKAWVKIAGWAVIFAAAGGLLYLFKDWLVAALNWDSYLTVYGSGMVQFLLEKMPEWVQLPFIVLYGMLQPVLPAAVVAPAPWIWKSLAIFRAVGWYALLPFLMYGFLRVWKAKPEHKRMMVLFFLVSCAWILIASVRAGGDQWDNPRYRTIFLPWMAVIGAWGIRYIGRTQDRWFRRIVIIESVFVLIFTEWYLTRYYPGVPALDFKIIVTLIVGVSLAVVAGGLLIDRRRRRGDLTDRPE